MINLAIGFAAGAACAVIFPPVYRFAAAKVAAVKAWLSSKGE